MQITIVAKRPEHHQGLMEYEPFVQTVFAKFGVVGVKKADIPNNIIFRPIITRRFSNGRIPLTITRGLAGCKNGHWWLAVNLTLGHPLLIKEVLIHEAAHIADAIKRNMWGHSKEWERVHRKLKLEVLGWED